MFTIQINGIDKLQDTFAQASDDLVEQVQEAIADTSQQLVELAKENCPVKTGKLRDSIAAEISDDGMSATITADVSYAPYVEYGPHAKPFLNPAFEEISPQLVSVLSDALGI
ncbi:MAG TPA: HK97-gp10 family putative phage morphogenesis protein [Bacteroidia bacterium]|jgi:HK97 gp10 family phage protein|nr:HK97-gp10 family putative phage morphogenesis protein [Bacteroidia bacterium]